MWSWCDVPLKVEFWTWFGGQHRSSSHGECNPEPTSHNQLWGLASSKRIKIRHPTSRRGGDGSQSGSWGVSKLLQIPQQLKTEFFSYSHGVLWIRSTEWGSLEKVLQTEVYSKTCLPLAASAPHLSFQQARPRPEFCPFSHSLFTSFNIS